MLIVNLRYLNYYLKSSIFTGDCKSFYLNTKNNQSVYYFTLNNGRKNLYYLTMASVVIYKVDNIIFSDIFR